MSSPPPPPTHVVRAQSQASMGGEGIVVSRADAPPVGAWNCEKAVGGGQRRVAVGVRCAVKVDSQMRASPSDLDFQPVPVHGKKLNQ